VIGNDLIHLPTACLRNKLNDHRFLNKAFTPEEKEQVTSEIDVWRMWAAKEAAYKIVNRKTKIRILVQSHLWLI
jgi:phosphopantetheinyl transferase (holo-ACP synthase)